MNNLFMPKDQKNLDSLLTNRFIPANARKDDALIISCGYDVYAISDFSNEPMKVGVYADKIIDGTILGNDLYFCTNKGVFNSSSWNYTSFIDSKNITSVGGKLFYFGSSGRIYSYDGADKREVALREEAIHCLGVHDGCLYDCGDYGIMRTSDNVLVTDKPTLSVYSYGDGILGLDKHRNCYDVKSDKNFFTFMGLKFLSLCFFNGEMVFDYGNWVVGRDGDVLLNLDKGIRSLFTVPKRYVGGLE